MAGVLACHSFLEHGEQLSVLEKVGLGVGNAPDRASFGRSKSITAHYHLGRIDLLKALSIWVEDWEVAILGGGWLNDADRPASSSR